MKQLFLIRKSVGAVSLAAALILTTIASGDASKITSLKVEPRSGSSSYVIEKSGALEVQDFLMKDPARLVVDFIGAAHDLDKMQFEGDGKYVKSVRTSQFTNDPQLITRIVFDLHANVAYKVINESDAVTVQFFAKNTETPAEKEPKVMKSSVPAMGAVDLNSTVDDDPAWDAVAPGPAAKTAQPKPATSQPAAKTAQPTADKPATSQPAAKTAQPTADKPVTSQPTARPTWTAPKEPLEVTAQPAPKPKWVTNEKKAVSTPANAGAATPPRQSPQSFATNTGLARDKNMSIDVQNAHILTVLRSMSEFSGVNIIAGPEVDGDVTAHLKNVPWRQALDIILKSHGFGWREEYGMIRVSTIERLTKEELEIQVAERQKDDLLPLHTEIMPLSYANADEIRKALKEMMTNRGSIEVEKSNNALVVTDIERVVGKIASMVEELDRKTRQVEIVAKMVDVDFEASREIGVRWEALNLSAKDAGAVGDAIIDSRVTNPAGVFRVGTVQSWGELAFILDALEKEQKANIISNPRIVTADNREANILVGKEIPLIVSDEAGNPITELTKVGIILRVTPHVNQDNSVTLDLHPEVSELSQQATVQGGVIISLSEADTRVVVGHGETAVIGGLISEIESKLQRGVPGLMSIPVLGNLFKFNSTTTKKRELIIFVTPKIVDHVASNAE
jgi:type II secretory pathway component GspD/PulD (secretin)